MSSSVSPTEQSSDDVSGKQAPAGDVEVAWVRGGTGEPLDDQASVFVQERPRGEAGEPVPLGVVLALYSEEAVELWHTLHDLAVMEQRLEGRYALDVCIVQDGWGAAPTSLKEYLRALFPCDAFDEIESGPADHDDPVTCIMHHAPSGRSAARKGLVKFNAPPGTRGAGEESGLALKITLVVKRENRRKANSHVWFFHEHGFANSCGAELLLLTDTGTRFDAACLRHLTTYMEMYPHATVCTGRMRIMSRAQQESDEWFVSFTSWLRMVSIFEHEASFNAFSGAFAMMGFLPVVPGPCGLFRRSLIVGEPMDKYLELVRPANDYSLLRGNVRLAEDRPFSFMPLLYGPPPVDPVTGEASGRSVHMGLEPRALFYFQQEDGITGAALQRRRWNNGTSASFFWLLSEAGTVFDSQRISFCQKLNLMLLSMIMLFVYATLAISPSIFIFTSWTFLDWGIRELDINTDSWKAGSLSVAVIFFAYYLFFVLLHGSGAVKFSPVALGPLAFFGAVASAGASIAYAHFLTRSLDSFSSLQCSQPDSFSGSRDCVFSSVSLAVPIIIFVCMALPFVIGFIYSPISVLFMVIFFIPFYITLPTISAFLGAYSISRLWDLSWGQRPDSSADQATGAKRAALWTKSLLINVLVILANVGVVALLVTGKRWYSVSLGVVVFVFFGVAVLLVLSLVYAIYWSLVARCFACCHQGAPVMRTDVGDASLSKSASKSAPKSSAGGSTEASASADSSASTEQSASAASTEQSASAASAEQPASASTEQPASAASTEQSASAAATSAESGTAPASSDS